MKNFGNLLFAGGILILTGCIPSLHGLVTDENRIIDDRILGRWAMSGPNQANQDPNERDDDTSWTFERAKQVSIEGNPGLEVLMEADLPRDGISKLDTLNYYLLNHVEITAGDTIINRMTVHLTRIKHEIFMDFQPNTYGNNLYTGRFATNFILAHTFAKVIFKDGKMHMLALHSDYLKELIEQKRIRLKHELVDGDIILTASTSELRDFIENYSDDPRLFDDEEVLVQHY